MNRFSRDLINQAFQKRPNIRIGKKGLSEGILKEIAYQLDQSELIKIKTIGIETKEEFMKIIEEIEKKKLGKVLSSRGRTFICTRGANYKSYL